MSGDSATESRCGQAAVLLRVVAVGQLCYGG